MEEPHPSTDSLVDPEAGHSVKDDGMALGSAEALTTEILCLLLASLSSVASLGLFLSLK